MLKISLFIVNRNHLLLSSLSRILKSENLFDVIVVMDDIGEALQEAVKFGFNDASSNLFLLDDISLREYVKLPRAEVINSVRIILLASANNKENFLIAIQQGVSGVLSEKVDIDELVSAIKAVAKGQMYFCSWSQKVLVDSVKEARLIRGRVSSSLTRRELQIMTLVNDKLSNKEIADKLFLTLAAVRFHLKNIYKKTNLSRKELSNLPPDSYLL